MLRILFATAVVALLGASAYAATAIESRNVDNDAGAGFVILTSLQRG